MWARHSNECGRCANEAELVAFDPAEGGFLCRTCRRGQAVDAETVHLIDQVLNGGLRALSSADRAGRRLRRNGSPRSRPNTTSTGGCARRTGAPRSRPGAPPTAPGLAAGDERDRYEDIAASAKDPGTERAGDEADIEAGDGSGIEVGREVDGATFE